MIRRECAIKRLFGTLPERSDTDGCWGWSIGETLQATDPIQPNVSFDYELAVLIARSLWRVAGWIRQEQ